MSETGSDHSRSHHSSRRQADSSSMGSGPAAVRNEVNWHVWMLLGIVFFIFAILLAALFILLLVNATAENGESDGTTEEVSTLSAAADTDPAANSGNNSQSENSSANSDSSIPQPPMTEGKAPANVGMVRDVENKGGQRIDGGNNTADENSQTVPGGGSPPPDAGAQQNRSGATATDASQHSEPANTSLQKEYPTSTFFEITFAAKKIVFLVDGSTNMAEHEFRRIHREILRSIEPLKPQQTFSVMFFADDAIRVFREDLAIGTVENRLAAADWLDSLEPSGSADLTPPLESAMELEPDIVFLFSTIEPASNFVTEFTASNVRRCVIHTIGFEGVVGTELLRLATENAGKHSRVGR